MGFKRFKLDPRVEQGLKNAGYEKATPIQDAAIPLVLEGHDLIGTAQTGTGKTAAFVLPILHQLLTNPKKHANKSRVLVVTPTRELAEQIHTVVAQLGRYTPVRSATVYGGVGMVPQERALRQGIDIIVACPGRLLDHLQRGTAKLDGVETLVLDEADRMLDMGFLPSIQQILQKLPAQRQTLLFSATFEKALEQLIHKSMRVPKRVTLGHEAPAATVAHAIYPVSQHLKTKLLLGVLKEMTVSSVLIFTRTKHRADRVVEKLESTGYAAAGLHANKSQGQRQRALEQFRAGKLQILVATDIAARGLDIASISHVINFDIPDSATTYIHRIGRTGRAAKTGDALTLVTPEDSALVRDIEKILGKPIEKKTVAGFDYKAAAAPHEPGRTPSRPGGAGARGGHHRAAPAHPHAGGKNRFQDKEKVHNHPYAYTRGRA
jgi:ATP-dependent RNA helicase RhlE